MVENEEKCFWSAQKIKGLKKGVGRGVTISVKLVGCKSREQWEELYEETTDSCESAL